MPRSLLVLGAAVLVVGAVGAGIAVVATSSSTSSTSSVVATSAEPSRPVGVAFTATAMQRSVAPGALLAYNLTVVNDGPGPLPAVRIVDEQVEGLLGVVAPTPSPSQGTCATSVSPPGFACDLGDIAPGSSATVLVHASAIARPPGPGDPRGVARSSSEMTSALGPLRATLSVPISEPAELSAAELDRLLATARACADVVAALVSGGSGIPFPGTVLAAQDAVDRGNRVAGRDLLFAAMQDLAPEAVRDHALVRFFASAECVLHMALLVPPDTGADGAPPVGPPPPATTAPTTTAPPPPTSSGPQAVDISGEYRLAVAQATCEGLEDCDTLAGEDLGVHILVSDCRGDTCDVVNLPGVWADSSDLTFDGESWTVTGTETADHGFYCYDAPRPTAFVLDLRITAGGAVTGTFGERTTTDVADCEPASESFTVSGSRS